MAIIDIILHQQKLHEIVRRGLSLKSGTGPPLPCYNPSVEISRTATVEHFVGGLRYPLCRST
jgi:hypothetical protein